MTTYTDVSPGGAWSVEGRIIDAGTDHGAPSIRLREHKSGREFWCRVDENARSTVAEMKIGDVWTHKRVRIRGIINFNDEGQIIRVYKGRLSVIDEPSISVRDLENGDFTEGYSVSEYLDRLRENEFG